MTGGKKMCSREENKKKAEKLDEVFAALDAAQIPADFMSDADRDRRPPQVRPELDAETDDLILSPAPQNWKAIFAAVDEAGFEDFLLDRDQGEAEKREPLNALIDDEASTEESENPDAGIFPGGIPPRLKPPAPEKKS
jgi:virulence-associated protein VagC